VFICVYLCESVSHVNLCVLCALCGYLNLGCGPACGAAPRPRGRISFVKIAVGSKNPLKLDAVRNVARKVFGPVQVEGIEVDSGVSHNPLTDAETIEGAATRAKAAREKSGADLGVGIEGGITELGGTVYTCVWCAVDTGSEVVTGGGVHVSVPPAVLRMITRERMEMGAAMDKLTSIEGTKRKMGFEGIITKGLINRQDSFEAVVGYTLAKLISPELYR